MLTTCDWPNVTQEGAGCLIETELDALKKLSQQVWKDSAELRETKNKV